MRRNNQSILKVCLLLILVLGSAIGAEIAPISGAPWNGYEIDGRTGGPDGVKVYDVNYDGLYDVVSGFEGASRSRVYINPGKDKCKENWPVVEVGHARHVEDALLTDLDGDGAVDVVSSCEVDAFMLNIHWAPKDPAKYQPPLRDAATASSNAFARLRPIRNDRANTLLHTYYSPLGQVIILENHAIGITISANRKVLMLRRSR